MGVAVPIVVVVIGDARNPTLGAEPGSGHRFAGPRLSRWASGLLNEAGVTNGPEPGVRASGPMRNDFVVFLFQLPDSALEVVDLHNVPVRHEDDRYLFETVPCTCVAP